MYGLNDLHYDLSYKRKIPSSPIVQNLIEFPDIKYKKLNIIMGANASGKTSLGKSICFIQNFLVGKTLNFKNMELENKLSHKDDTFGFDVVFYTNSHVYKVKTLFDETNLLYESWKFIELKKYYTNNMVLDMLKKEKVLFEYEKDKNNIRFEHRSAFLSDTLNLEHLSLMTINNTFSFRFSGDQYNNLDMINRIEDITFFENIIRAFDPSITKVERSLDDSEEIMIHCANGHTERLSKTGLQENSILSSGTKEAINMSKMLYLIKKSKEVGLYFIDEQMAFSHADMEKAIINLILTWIDKKDVQVFITSHNYYLFDLDLPVFNFTLLKKNPYKNEIELIRPEDEVIHKSRTIRNMIEKDIFSTSPSLDSLMELIDE